MSIQTELYQRANGVWYARLDIDGKVERRSTKTRDETEARRIYSDWRRDLLERPETFRAKETTLKQAVEAYLKHLHAMAQNGAKSESTYDYYYWTTKRMVKSLGPETVLADLTLTRVLAWVAKRQEEGHKVKRELTALHRTLKYAQSQACFDARINVNAYRPFEPIKEGKDCTRYLKDFAELFRIVAQLKNPEQGAQVVFHCATGANFGEASRAERRDIDLKRGTVYIRGTKTKHRAREIPIIGIMKPLIEHVLSIIPEDREGPMFPSWNVMHGLPDAAVRAGLERVTTNDLRRTLCTWLGLHGVDAETCAKVLRNTPAMVRQHYDRSGINAQATGRLVDRIVGDSVQLGQVYPLRPVVLAAQVANDNAA